MANRRPQPGRRNDFNRNDRGKNFGRAGVSPWQGAGPAGGLPNLLPLSGSTEATLALASNIINLLQPRQNPVPSLLDMPIRRDFGPNMGRYDRGFGANRMGNQGNFRRTGNYNRAGERINTNRKPFRPNDGPRQQNKSSPKKEADSKAKPVKESDQEKEGDGTEKTEVKEEGKSEQPKTRYDDISQSLLKCHICNKSMWDGRSFENHLSGRAHAIMMQKTAESYALTADTMRQEFKIREMKRTRKIGQQPPRDFYCAMCDMYAADGPIHRTTVGHRKLKKYLHPTCTSCHKEMPTRIELDEHRLTAEHLRNMQDKQETMAKPKPEVMVISTLSMEQTYLRDDRQRWRRGDRADRADAADSADTADKDKQDTDKEIKTEQSEDVEVKKEGDETEAKQEPDDAKKEAPLDNENTILDFKEGDDITGVTADRFPAYSTGRGVGESFLSEFRCVECRLCRKLLDSEETARVHLRTWRHHHLFLRLLHDRAGTGTGAAQQPNQDGGKRPLNSEETGNWKRRKTTPDDDDCDDRNDDDTQTNGHVAVKEEGEEQNTEEALADGDVDMPAADELEDWEQSVDEILNDEKAEEEKQSEQEAEPEKEEEPEDAKPAPAPEKPKASPRGRGRGRRRY